MGRKKQRPRRAVGLRGGSSEAELNDRNLPTEAQKDDSSVKTENNPFFVPVDKSNWAVSGEHFDISEIVLSNLAINPEFHGYDLKKKFFEDSRFSLRFRLDNAGEFLSRIKLGHWPELPASSIQLEFVERSLSQEGKDNVAVMLSGNFDGVNEAVSGLVHLASLNFLTLRPMLGIELVEDLLSVRIRVEILRAAFDACSSLVDETRKTWKKSMMSVMAWLRPEVLTSEARYRFGGAASEEGDQPSCSRKQSRFDVGGFYEAIKPSKEEPMLDVDLPHLLPELRPYQRRAAHWMVQREKGDPGCSVSQREQLGYPLCVPLKFIEGSSTMYYNPFCGNISLHPQPLSTYVSGGVLADEMGLGKTVELLACIFAHQMPPSEVLDLLHMETSTLEDKSSHMKRLKRERVECLCGAVTESIWYEGLWVQCDVCDAWQHASCVGFSAKGNTSDKTGSTEKLGERETESEVVVTEGVHICSICSDLIQATESPLPLGATLIVCPTPILSQWQTEINRHTTPGSLRICVYDGVNTTLHSDAPFPDINELINADIVLTTYDVLKDDLSHDSDRYEGDRRTLRYEKRYAVIPTLLTRILWWRVCLDEAQMVESTAASATEMALRLHAKHRWCITGTPIQRKLDDLYGLLKFLSASPFDVFRWWVEVIRDPYEAGDSGAILFTHKFLKKIMWRSSKIHVSEELEIPMQEEWVSWLTLSPIEEHFYQRQHDACLRDAHEVIKNLKRDVLKRNGQGSERSDHSPDQFITHLEAAKLFNSLLKLRQACCHPQVGSSGLRSLQQSPMTMEEILSALIGKTKIEGEEELRKVVSAINGLAGIAILKQDASQAVSLYKEALAVAEENSEDFRLDPLLNIHIHHNLPDTIQLFPDSMQLFEDAPVCSAECNFRAWEHEQSDCRPLKRARIATSESNVISDCQNLNESPISVQAEVSSEKICNPEAHMPSQLTTHRHFREKCDNLKKKYLSLFYSKWSMTQQEFKKSYDQICIELSSSKDQQTTWWLEALHYIEQNQDLSSDLIRKIGDTLSVSLNTSRASKVPPCFGSIATLKYYIQTSMDSLEESRNSLLKRVLEIDCSMEHPDENDIRRVRHCPNCQNDGDGPLCVHCELDELFQVYEARLFKTLGNNGEVIRSAEEAIDIQRKRSALNRFYRGLSQHDKKSASATSEHEDEGKKRDVMEKVTVSKSPSDLEVVLGIIKNSSRGLLDGEGKSAATKQLLLLEGMRKEYPHARSLARAQAQVLCAHDEVIMAISRLRLREDDNDDAVDALSPEELDVASTQNSGDKFLALSSLSRVRGQLRYLKGMVQSKQGLHSEATNESSLVNTTNPVTPENKCISEVKGTEESCPVCQEKLKGQKMVFQCGHIVCCKCLFAMTERRFGHHGHNWVMCPTCRQHTDYGSIAFADDSRNSSSRVASSIDCVNSETHITVKGSYSTKIEAVTRRILSIKSNDPKAKVLVFTSWNDVLDVLEHAFIANEISYARMKGGRKSNVAINHFKGLNEEKMSNVKRRNKQPQSDFVQVLLILIQHGANGLNLLEAQHVILVEPLLNPAAEAQAIGRVHRIGQDKKTLVHRFIVKDTVEESIYKLNRSRNTGSFISGYRKNQDQPVLTLKDVESLFRVAPTAETDEQKANNSLSHLPPSVAAAMAAERRLLESRA